MNAYELADAIEDWDSDGQWDTPAANMLRQQADRIAELEKQGEPVAWMQMHHKDNIPTKFSPVKVWEDDIPLYTTPQIKELSDEEILNVAFCCEVNTVAIENDWDGTVIDFARAILKKASEK